MKREEVPDIFLGSVEEDGRFHRLRHVRGRPESVEYIADADLVRLEGDDGLRLLDLLPSRFLFPQRLLNRESRRLHEHI